MSIGIDSFPPWNRVHVGRPGFELEIVLGNLDHLHLLLGLQRQDLRERDARLGLQVFELLDELQAWAQARARALASEALLRGVTLGLGDHLPELLEHLLQHQLLLPQLRLLLLERRRRRVDVVALVDESVEQVVVVVVVDVVFVSLQKE